ncbi:MAG: glycosyltransferase, partial [Acidobacteriota bacterium]
AEVIFAATRRGPERQILGDAGYQVELVRVEPLRGGSPMRKLKGIATLPLALIDAARLLRRARPDVVMGVGGYLSGPLLAVASLAGAPTLLLEPNVKPGLANRWLSRLVDAAAVAWEETGRHFGDKAFVSGNPVRQGIARVASQLPNGDVRLLVLGGSQGSTPLNCAMVEALPYLRDQRQRLHMTHQTGKADLEMVRAAYQKEAFAARVEPYLRNMESEYADCNMVVSRAGATTCAELAAAGRPSVLIPLPAAGGHQQHNAAAMRRAGAAAVILQSELSGARLSGTLVQLLQEPGQLQHMSERARALARPEAAQMIAERLAQLARH